jgi:CheY-like chemotaxis protein
MAEERRYRVLVVDDQEDILRTIELMLQKSPFDPVTVASGHEALEIAAKQEFDLMLLDILMPEISGISLCVRLRRIPHLEHVPVVVLTAANDFTQLQLARKVGADEILLKPVGKRVLVEKMLGAIAKHQQETPPSS